MKKISTFILITFLVLALSSCSDKIIESWKKESSIKIQEENKSINMSNSNYKEYSKDAVMSSQWDILLFFHASWCPKCAKLDSMLISSDIPDNLTILKVDYDNSQDLKEMYEVQMHSTIVQIDNEWNMIKKWIWSSNLEEILSEISKASSDMIDKEIIVTDEKTIDSMNSEGLYLDYSKDSLMSAEGDIVLFFHADWCPACVSIDNKIKNDSIPSDLTILKVDFDNSTELKKVYWVTTQTTFVQVDSDWNMIKKWVSARDLDDIISRID